ncbi:MAG: polyphosphate kinase 1 [Armatimonadota bacterium]|nr:polyphosphate kinase 1 [Armatimonadota bacterium]
MRRSIDAYINRETSWIQFNARVLEEAARNDNPLLERLRFLSIVESNLDEFYMVRVSGLIELMESGIQEVTPDGKTPAEQLEVISKDALQLRRKTAQVFEKQLRPALRKAGIVIRRYSQLSRAQKAKMDGYFEKEIFALCTPLALKPSHTIPFISNRSLNLCVDLKVPGRGRSLARIKVPTVVPRAIRITPRKNEFILLDDLISQNLDRFFPGIEVVDSYVFRVIRDADVEIQELEAADLVAMVERSLRLRRFGEPVLLEVETKMPARIKKFLMSILSLDASEVFAVDGIIGMDVFDELAEIDNATLRWPKFRPYTHPLLAKASSLFDAIKKHDVLLHHPFDSFEPVEQFVASAAVDPHVIGIKQTLYRVGSQSPIVESLLEAAANGKQVAVLVELKARFDESNNLVWARALERAGVHVTYGFAEMKTHCKMCLVVRRENSGIRRYAHLATGNYNPSTARLYTDVGVFTCDKDVTQDVAEIFNVLTGFSAQNEYRRVLVAPGGARDGIVERIEREIATHKKSGAGRILFKANSLVDPEVIDALYDASDAGIPVDLIIRGICCLRPGVVGLSENIRVYSVVGRFLEHSRIYYFANGGKPEALVGSADIMRRNFDRRIETLLTIKDADMAEHLLCILEVYLRDNTNTWMLRPGGDYARKLRSKDELAYTAQSVLIEQPSSDNWLAAPRNEAAV